MRKRGCLPGPSGNRPNGFTIIELLIALQLALIVAGLAYLGYAFWERKFSLWQQKARQTEALITISSSLSRLMDTVETVRIAEAAHFEGITVAGDTLSLRITNRILLNRRLLDISPFRKITGRMDYFLAPPRFPNRLVSLPNVAPRDRPRIVAIQFSLELHARSGSILQVVFCRLSKRRVFILE